MTITASTTHRPTTTSTYGQVVAEHDIAGLDTEALVTIFEWRILHGARTGGVWFDTVVTDEDTESDFELLYQPSFEGAVDYLIDCYGLADDGAA